MLMKSNIIFWFVLMYVYFAVLSSIQYSIYIIPWVSSELEYFLYFRVDSINIISQFYSKPNSYHRKIQWREFWMKKEFYKIF